MSGGSLNYFYCQLQDHVGDFGDKELDELVKDLAELFHDREWYLSCDYGKGTWIESRDAFKEKWFTKHGRQERIEKYLAEFTNEVRESFGLVKGDGMSRLDQVIADITYVRSCLKLLKTIQESGDCNICKKNRACEYVPKVGEQVRYNCPFFESEVTECAKQ